LHRRPWGILLAVGTLAVTLAAGHALQDHSPAVKSVPTGRRVIALTIDDGPDPLTTPALLKVLAAKNARATFFLLGENAARYPDLAAAVAAAGHELGSHGYGHRFPNKLPPHELFADLEKAEEAIGAAGVRPTLYRPPGGGYNDAMVDALARRGYTTVLWSVDPRDWERRSAAQTAATVVKRAAPGAIVLLHEGECAAHTPEAVGMIIDRLRAEGYELVTVGELLLYWEVRR
jgi:peptidoglycan/xylan/chitin deacetylase (PgdA/CDA1 family)